MSLHHNTSAAARAVLASCAVLGLLLLIPQGGAEDKPADKPKAEPPALPLALSGFEDEGSFSLYQKETRLATMTFKWRTDGSFESKATLSLGGQSVNFSTKVTPDKDGRWVKVAVESPRGPETIERTGGVVTRKFKEKVETVNLKPGTGLFESFSPALMTQFVRAYDRAKGGKQTCHLFVPPGSVVESSLERKEPADRSVKGRDVRFDRYVLSIKVQEVTLWVDPAGKLVYADVPAQHVAYVRDGYEILGRAAETDPLISTAKYEVRHERDVGVPMRDGAKLLTDLYRPGAEGKFPVILIRTPYKKDMMEPQAAYYARRGYVVAVQNCRGRFGSPGTWEPFVHEPTDGYDAVEWLAGQPWSSGKVGMIGGSYVGWVQWWAAAQRPPHLVTIIPNVAPPDPFFNIPYEYGVFFLRAAIWWAEVLDREVTADLSGSKFADLMEKKYSKLLSALPVIDLDKKVLGKENAYWRKWIEHPVNDQYWEQANFLERLKDVTIPVYHQSGWFDGDGIGSKLNYLAMARHGHRYQKLVLGPWGHTDEAARSLGDRDFGADALVDLQRSYLRWFDHWLKGVDNGIDREPLVSIFVMGSNQWLHGPTYPLPGTHFEKWYLAGGHANTSGGAGRLSPEPPAEKAEPDRYTYDPADPTPDPEAYEEPDAPADKSAAKPQSREEKKKAAEAYHADVTRRRDDILVYATQPLEKPLTFAGPLSAVLYASSSARDTDWFVRLMDVDGKGKIFQLAEGKVRARYRLTTKKPEFLEPEKVYEYTIDLWQTGITIPKGSRLRVEVASASFPSFSRNLNTGGHNETETAFVKARQQVYHSREYPSHILLPVVELKAKGK
jgi:putative CocE/NonD family hydrolase